MISAVSSAMGRQPIRYPTLGGSAPFYIFSSRLGVPTIGMPVVNYDNNQHGPNENIRLGAYFHAVRAIGSIHPRDAVMEPTPTTLIGSAFLEPSCRRRSGSSTGAEGGLGLRCLARNSTPVVDRGTIGAAPPPGL